MTKQSIILKILEETLINTKSIFVHVKKILFSIFLKLISGYKKGSQKIIFNFQSVWGINTFLSFSLVYLFILKFCLVQFNEAIGNQFSNVHLRLSQNLCYLESWNSETIQIVIQQKILTLLIFIIVCKIKSLNRRVNWKFN